MEMLGREWDTLYTVHAGNCANSETAISNVIAKFNTDRIKAMTAKWWSIPQFAAQQQIIEVGLDQFLTNTKAGDIAAIKTLVTELDGILQRKHFEDLRLDTRKSKPRTEYLRKLGMLKFGSEEATILPNLFSDYLNKVIFASFDIATGSLDMSRNSAAHGVAKPEAYTRERALQLILTLDQIAWYS